MKKFYSKVDVEVETIEEFREEISYKGKGIMVKNGKKFHFNESPRRKDHRNPVKARTSAGKIWLIESTGKYRITLNVTESELYSRRKITKLFRDLLNKLEKN